ALDGVGPSMARGSQPENGSNALLPATATMMSTAMMVAVGPVRPIVDDARAPPNSRDRLSVPATWRSSTAADSIAASLMRYTDSTRSAFETGAGRSWKNATSSAELRPTNSQPMKRTPTLPASDTSSMPVTNIASSTKYRLYPGSRCRYRFENAETTPAIAAERAANPSDNRSTRNSIAMPPSCDVDQSPYDTSRVPVPAPPCTMSASSSAALAVVIAAAAIAPVQRSGSGRSSSNAVPSSASRSAGAPTPAITSTASGTVGVTPRAHSAARADRREASR